jgi:type III pantothenate kinase
MNLVIDIGNTRIKAAVFDGSRMIEDSAIDGSAIDLVEMMLERFPGIQQAIVSSVHLQNPALSGFIRKKVRKLIEVDTFTPVPVHNHYKTPDTLGKDRLAALVGAYAIYPDSNILIIDTGTTITYDFLDSDNQYSGGNISPGMEMRLKALNQFTQKLPKVDVSEVFFEMGYDTETSIRSGVVNGIMFEMDSYIRLFKQKHKNLKVILTGGDANFFVKKLKKTIFVIPNLVLIGLNHILQYNEKIP